MVSFSSSSSLFFLLLTLACTQASLSLSLLFRPVGYLLCLRRVAIVGKFQAATAVAEHLAWNPVRADVGKEPYSVQGDA